MPFIAAAITSVGAAFGATVSAEALLGKALVKLLVSTALSQVMVALGPKPKAAGLRTSQTLTGGVNPCSFVMGTYATSGVAVCPAMSHGKVGNIPNAYLTYVIELSDIPGMALTGLIIDGESIAFSGTAHPDYGTPLQGRFAGYGWIKYYDGSQTTADAMLLAKYGSYAPRPWTSDMIGRGICYAILTFKYNKSVFTNLPAVRFVVSGAPLYDPRKDTTVGGSGSHRWGTISTYQASANPMVQAYNILRGVTLPDGTIWGGDAQAGDLPLAEWFAAMNACDAAVTLAAGGTEAAYRAGFEITLADEPAAVLEELFKAASAQIVDMGGIWKPRVGGPGLPVYVFTDDDVIISRPQEFEPFPGLDQTYNGASARYPDPTNLWETTEAPPRYSSAYEVADGGRRLVAALELPAVPYAQQVQRLLRGWVEDARRDRRHVLNLPPAAAIIEPLDSVAWTSARNGYTSKVFEVSECADTLRSAVQQLSLRERDAADYSWSSAYETPVAAAVGGIVVPDPQEIGPIYPANCYPDYDIIREEFYASPTGAAFEFVPTVLMPLGQQYLRIKINALLASVTTGWFPVEPDTDYVIGGAAWVGSSAAGSGTATLEFETGSLDVDGIVTSLGLTTVKTTTDATFSAGGSFGSATLLTGSTARRGRFVMTRAAIGTSNARFGGFQVLKKSNSGLISDGAVQGNHIDTNVVTAVHIGDGQVNTSHLVIDELLEISAIEAGFSMGKTTATDFANDGLYMGRTATALGALGFGFLMGKTDGAGVKRFIQHTSDEGLSIVNAQYGLLTDLTSTPSTITTSQTVTLNPLIRSLSMTILGGGAGGWGTAGTGTQGGDTVVQLFDGATNTGISWTSAGGAASGSGVAGRGESTVLGVGGVSAYGYVSGYTSANHFPVYSTRAATAATGYGAGGGGGASGPNGGAARPGGKSATAVTISNFDIGALGLTAPKLVISIGAGGTRATGSTTLGTNGAPGVAKIEQILTDVVPAGVVPLYPTATGTFTKAANATGSGVFPNLGVGLWVLAEASGAVLGLNSLQITDALGSSMALTLTNALTATFVSNTRPNILTGNATARTIQYAFYKMQVG